MYSSPWSLWWWLKTTEKSPLSCRIRLTWTASPFPLFNGYVSLDSLHNIFEPMFLHWVEGLWWCSCLSRFVERMKSAVECTSTASGLSLQGAPELLSSSCWNSRRENGSDLFCFNPIFGVFWALPLKVSRLYIIWHLLEIQNPCSIPDLSARICIITRSSQDWSTNGNLRMLT